MYNLIIVDDEINIRSGIARYIGSHFSDVNIAATFDDGSKAIDFLKNQDVHIVISDIRMSSASGIDLARFIYNSKPHIKVIFISGYKEFEYAKQAIDLNVQNFISKPVNLSELTEAIKNVIKIIEAENETQKTIEQYSNLYSLAKTSFFTDILLGNLKIDEQIEEKAFKIGLSKDYLSSKCCVIIITLPNPAKELMPKDNFYTLIQNLLRDIDKIDEYSLTLKNDYMLSIVGVSSKFDTTSEIEAYLNTNLCTLKETLISIAGVEINYNIEFIGENVFSLKRYTELNHKKIDNSQLIQLKCKDLVTSIITKNHAEALQILNTLKQHSVKYDFHHSKQFFTSLFTSIHENLSTRTPHWLDIDYKSLDSIINSVELFKWCDSILEKLFETIDTQQSYIELSTIQKVKNFIEKNYMLDISLDDIANHVSLNSAYLSRFFKANTGTTLTDYIIETRMKEAISLFQMRKYKINEISMKCGYQNSKYFTKVFKKFSGYTPTEYIKIIASRSEDDV